MSGEQIFCARGSARRANICAPSMLGEQLARRCARRTSPSTLAEQRAEMSAVVEDFCERCGSYLPFPTVQQIQKGYSTCKLCDKKRYISLDDFQNQPPRLVFQKFYNQSDSLRTKQTTGTSDGPVVDRACPKCPSKKMSYATRQTRSADEGMTVFFTCVKCGYKDIEYA
uniref:DNA-directed RNA polymerase I subunit RPA12 n=1 Tax=Romanomermis culicivorax TaxID=13658 RepID=A0A915K692_ROMCU